MNLLLVQPISNIRLDMNLDRLVQASCLGMDSFTWKASKPQPQKAKSWKIQAVSDTACQVAGSSHAMTTTPKKKKKRKSVICPLEIRRAAKDPF